MTESPRKTRRGRRRWPVSPGLLLLGLLASCAEPQDPANNPIRVHPDSWMNEMSADFHGDKVAMDTAEPCQSCHGTDYTGDAVAASCFDCHNGPSGHPSGWISPADPFHGAEVRANSALECRDCHGVDWSGGWAEVSCYNACHYGPGGHPPNWALPSSNPFHGAEVVNNGSEQCQDCHGADYLGGWTGTSCYDCHNGPGGP